MAACVLACLSWGACAETVGRTQVDLSAQPWVLLTTYPEGLRFDGGRRVTPIETKVFVLPGEGPEPKALLVISNTQTSFGRPVQWITDKCPQAHAGYFADDHGTDRQTRVRRCIVVNPSFAPLAYFKPEAPELAALTAKGFALFKSGHSLRALFGSDAGELLRVNLITRRGFTGLPGTPPKSLDLHGVPAPLVAWGEALQDAVESSVMSLAGKLTLPPMSF